MKSSNKESDSIRPLDVNLCKQIMSVRTSGKLNYLEKISAIISDRKNVNGINKQIENDN